jgi:hypothetical protein
MWHWVVLVCAAVNMVGAHSVIWHHLGVYHRGGGLLVLVWGGDGSERHW